MIFGSWWAGNWKLEARIPDREGGTSPASDTNGLNLLTEPVPGDGFLLLALG